MIYGASEKSERKDKLDRQLPETRCSGDDLAMLKAKAALAGISRGEYLRRLIRNTDIVVRQSSVDVLWCARSTGSASICGRR